MRVEIIVEADAAGNCEAGGEAARAGLENRALLGFLDTVNAGESFFRVEKMGAAFPAPATDDGVKSFRMTFRIGFRHGEFHQNRGMFFTLLEKMAELLGAAGAAETLGVRMAIENLPGDAAGRGKHALILELAARGETAEQAELRWGLGLAHVQKALLFTSRQLRQQVGSRGDSG